MAGSQADEIDWENLSNKEHHDKFQQMMTEQVQDVLHNFEEAMDWPWEDIRNKAR